MEEIFCNKCKATNPYRTEMKSVHLTAYCTICGSYLKHISYKEPTIYFGKYSGKKITEIDDVKYLEWALENIDSLKPKIRESIKIQVDKLNNK